MMHDDWGHGGGGGYWWWIPMTIMMVVFWGGLIWVAVTLIRRPNNAGTGAPSIAAFGTPAPPRPTAREILDERLARGEIDADEYRQRLDALERSRG